MQTAIKEPYRDMNHFETLGKPSLSVLTDSHQYILEASLGDIQPSCSLQSRDGTRGFRFVHIHTS